MHIINTFVVTLVVYIVVVVVDFYLLRTLSACGRLLLHYWRRLLPLSNLNLTILSDFDYAQHGRTDERTDRRTYEWLQSQIKAFTRISFSSRQVTIGNGRWGFCFLFSQMLRMRVAHDAVACDAWLLYVVVRLEVKKSVYFAYLWQIRGIETILPRVAYM